MPTRKETGMLNLFFHCLTLAIIVGVILQPCYTYGVNEQLWLQIIYPDEIAYHFKILPAKDFGGVMDRTIRGIPMIAAEPWQACSNRLNSVRSLRGHVALVVRGECSFVTKALNIQRHGAIAVLITNYDEDDIDMWIDMSEDGTGRASNVTIPTFYLLGKDGHKIKEAMDLSYYNIALVNIPANVSDVSSIAQPKWDLW